ncbi:MAG: competence protein ComEC [Sphingomonas bacterium]|uniref:ComEC/Rec2 family competence protein n=1 Tax=Sphingomonas bacterium TaxID=1895847 RepID=UPI00260DFB54|nr:ComEC/Rec2 family competence protein [Sphingomonas bacterium]MDB5695226.1 competence protein ComEC [Sphingomonas bacterium]
MASSAAAAASIRPPSRQTVWRPGAAAERWLEAERDQLPLWLPVALGAGIAIWFLLPDSRAWTAAALTLVGVGLAAVALGRHGRLARAVGTGALTAALGLGLIWWRAERIASRVLAGPTVARFTATVDRVEPLAARGLVRLTLLPAADATDAREHAVELPPRVRVNLAEADVPKSVGQGAIIKLRARLMPPPAAAVPGAYDFARQAWFWGVGGTGRGFAPVTVVQAAEGGGGLRAALSRHIGERLPGSEGGIAAALATGDVGAIGLEDAEAMRRAGLAHLLSVSGLHITAVIAATFLLVLRLLALSPWLALRIRLPLVAAVAGAVAAIGYTLLTGSQVPTIRSCVAALLVLAALAMGREAMTLRLVATGALVVLLFRPESLAGPSFQLSFAAITAIVALHEHPRMRVFLEPHEEGIARRGGRALVSLLATGLVVEVALMPIAAYHFHRAGLYGALANIVAIPLTTFVIMPLEAGALLLDLIGLGAPLWWLAGVALSALLWLAHVVAAAPGAVAALPATPGGAFGLMVGGGLWLALWRTRWRRLGLAPLAFGVGWALTTPAPDLLVTGDGRHLAIRMGDGQMALLRDRAGDYTRTMLAENSGVAGELALLPDQGEARCSADLCMVDVLRGGRSWRVLATRSGYPVPALELIAACRQSDIVVSERWLPRGCRPRWLKLDRPVLAGTGGVAITFGDAPRVVTVLRAGDRHPWRVPPMVARPTPAWTPRRTSNRRNVGPGDDSRRHRTTTSS